ncbi:MAG TPA: META domain-containing protein [Acidimicrobiia bacterium]|nr:META domain-containing protein [Acidimicrobiia bacterium]
MTTLTRTVAATLLATALLASCGQETLPSASPFGDRAWGLKSGTVDGSPIVLVDGHDVTLTASNGSVSGTAACNHYSGTLVETGTRSTISEIAVTEMYCGVAGVMELEAAFLTALQRIDTAFNNEDDLVLTGEGVELRFSEIPPDPPAALTGTNWRLESLVDGDSVSTVAAPAFIVFEDDGHVGGSNGCNLFGGSYDTTAGFRDLFQTLIGCMGAVADQEAFVMSVLTGDAEVAIDGANLTIGSGERALLYRASAPEPNLALRGTTWTLTTVIDGETASTTAADAWIRIEDNGSVTGNTGCNQFSGTYDDNGFGPLGLTKMACLDEAVADQERLVVAVLESSPLVTVDGSTLTIASPDGTALVFDADRP